jgi:hypothetical protein
VQQRLDRRIRCERKDAERRHAPDIPDGGGRLKREILLGVDVPAPNDELERKERGQTVRRLRISWSFLWIPGQYPALSIPGCISRPRTRLSKREAQLLHSAQWITRQCPLDLTDSMSVGSAADQHSSVRTSVTTH